MENEKELLEAINRNTEEIKLLKEEVRLLKKESPVLPGYQGEYIAPAEEAVDLSLPIPKEYRELVNAVLNKSFGIKMEKSDDKNDVMKLVFTIEVPEKYGDLIPEGPGKELRRQWDIKTDLRSRTLSNIFTGVNEAKVFAERIFKDLGPKAQAEIVKDRETL